MPIEEFKAVDWKPFRKAFPVLFGARRITSLDAGEGWRTLLWDLCVALEARAQTQIANDEEPIRVVQVKQKFGGLRCYLNRHDEIADCLIDAAEAIAEKTCEACGALAKARRIEGWISTFCPKHVELALDYEIWRLNKDP
ncbi:MAG: hypothetical protein JSR64_10625 [Nitrospira sp.]|nr:hypothetical protein [Nitrospira sp.]